VLYDTRGIQQRPVERKFMKKTRQKIDFENLPKNYIGLCKILAPRPIRDSVEFQNVTEIADAMAGHDFTPDQEDYFDLLCLLIEDYEKDMVKPPKVTALEMIQHLLDAHDMNATDLARLLGVHRTLGGMILRGERKLTLNHVRTLARHFYVSADLFIV
jgi:HTH-type transcriptional regulator/antitoxin HigA